MTKTKKMLVQRGEQLLAALPHNGLDWNQDHFRLVTRTIQIFLDLESGLNSASTAALRMRIVLSEALRLDAVEAGELHETQDSSR